MPTLQQRPSGVVFDFDGTIADTRSLIVASYQETFRRLNLPVPEAARIVETIGVPLASSIERICDNDALDTAQAVATYRAVFRDMGFEHVQAFPGLSEIIRKLQRDGLALAVASSRSHESLDDMVAHLGMSDCFSVIAGREDAERERPDPEMLRYIAQQFALPAGELLMVGDTTFDIEMGHGAGAATCAVTWGNHDRRTLEAVTPTVVVETADELAAELGLELDLASAGDR